MVPTFARPVMAQVTRGFSRSVVSHRSFSSSSEEFSIVIGMIRIIGFASRAVAGAATGLGLGILTLKMPYLDKLKKDKKELREEREGKAACKNVENIRIMIS